MILVKIGCGVTIRPAWINHTAAPAVPEVRVCEARGVFPFADSVAGVVRKPDSLYVEAVRPAGER